MALSWSDRRKVLYLSVAGIIALVALVFVYETFFTIVPTCFDRVQNGDEHGIDCGGSCALVCQNEERAPVVLWSRCFETGPSTYTVVAYIENDNQSAAAKQVPYSFQLFDADNQLIIERDGVANLPPVRTIPIIETNLKIPNRTPARVLFGFSYVPTWYKVASTTMPKLVLGGQTLSADASRLSVNLRNDSFVDAPKVTVAAVLFDASGTARAASKSVVSVPGQTMTPVVFTFPGGVPGIVRAEVTMLPPF